MSSIMQRYNFGSSCYVEWCCWISMSIRRHLIFPSISEAHTLHTHNSLSFKGNDNTNLPRTNINQNNFDSVSNFTTNNPHILVGEWNLDMNLFVEINFLFLFLLFCIRIKKLFFISLFPSRWFFVLTHWSM